MSRYLAMGGAFLIAASLCDTIAAYAFQATASSEFERMVAAGIGLLLLGQGQVLKEDENKP